MAPTYGAILAANIRGIRSRRGIGQEALAKRMRGLGHEWVRQTVGATERGRRRVLAEEVAALAAALETTVTALMAPSPDDKLIEFGGLELKVRSMQGLITGHNDHAIYWKDDVPVLREVTAWWGEGDQPPEEA
jgi:transcriptional regulator with XRE-family HTH domain